MTTSPNNPLQETVWPPKDVPEYDSASCVFNTAREAMFDDDDRFAYSPASVVSGALYVFRLPASVSIRLLIPNRIYLIVGGGSVKDMV